MFPPDLPGGSSAIGRWRVSILLSFPRRSTILLRRTAESCLWERCLSSEVERFLGCFFQNDDDTYARELGLKGNDSVIALVKSKAELHRKDKLASDESTRSDAGAKPWEGASWVSACLGRRRAGGNAGEGWV